MFQQDISLDQMLHREKPSFWSFFIKAPYITIAKWLYSVQQTRLSSNSLLESKKEEFPISVVCVSDTHNSQLLIPEGDMFIHAGDLSQGGTWQEIQTSLDWINELPHPHKVVIAGNHDMYLDAQKRDVADRDRTLDWGSIVYLQDTSTVLRFKGGRALTIHGTPHTRKHGSWGFQYARGTDVFTNTIPSDTDILISHSPPRFHLDIDGWGDDHLLHELWRGKPVLHVFGHVHEGYGQQRLVFDTFQRQYEQICRRSRAVNMWPLLKMAFSCLAESWWLKRAISSRVTVAVNASAVGGLRDDIKRRPIVVVI